MTVYGRFREGRIWTSERYLAICWNGKNCSIASRSDRREPQSDFCCSTYLFGGHFVHDPRSSRQNVPLPLQVPFSDCSWQPSTEETHSAGGGTTMDSAVAKSCPVDGYMDESIFLQVLDASLVECVSSVDGVREQSTRSV